MIIVDEKEMRQLSSKKKILNRARPEAKDEKIDANAKATASLAEAIKQLAAKPPPQVQQQDLSGLVDVIQQTQETQNQILATLQQKPKPQSWNFEVIRNANGGIKSIKANEITRS